MSRSVLANARANSRVSNRPPAPDARSASCFEICFARIDRRLGRTSLWHRKDARVDVADRRQIAAPDKLLACEFDCSLLFSHEPVDGYGNGEDEGPTQDQDFGTCTQVSEHTASQIFASERQLYPVAVLA